MFHVLIQLRLLELQNKVIDTHLINGKLRAKGAPVLVVVEVIVFGGSTQVMVLFSLDGVYTILVVMIVNVTAPIQMKFSPLVMMA